MRLNNRITSLENRSVWKQRHVIAYTVDRNTDEEQVKQEAINTYCEKHNLNPEKLENKEYGEVLFIVRNLISTSEESLD